MLECPNCRRSFRAGTRFCGSCGTALPGTLSAAVASNSGNVGALVSGQRIPGFQAMDSPEDTLVRKKPDGLSWQTQSIKLTNNEPLQTASRISSEVEEPTTVVVWPAQRSDASPAPIVPAASFTPGNSALSVQHVSHVLPATPVPPLTSEGTSVAAGSVLAPVPAKTPGEHAPFAIPARPGRASGHSAEPLEAATETTVVAAHVLAPAADILDRQSALNLPADSGEALIDYTAFPAIITGETPDQSASTVPAVPLAVPLDGAFISVDLMAEIAMLAPTLTLPGTVVPALVPETPDAPEVDSIAQTPPASFVQARSVEAAEQDAMPQAQANAWLVRVALDSDLAGAAARDAMVIEDEGVAKTPEPEIGLEKFFSPFREPEDVAGSAHLRRPADPYLHLKQELAAQRMEITIAMDELLPLVYENHREENQTLFASILAHRPPLDDEAWGHAAFVLGAYGNYMYRNPLSFTKKLEIWRAQLWAVYYERSYRRKYLAQRCQQLIHYFQGCAENPTFLAIALHDLGTLYLYLEPGSLRKLQLMLEALPVPPRELLQRIDEQMVVAEGEKAERMTRQQVASHLKNAAPASQSASPGVSHAWAMGNPISANSVRVTPAGMNRSGAKPALAGGRKSLAQAAQIKAVFTPEVEARKWLGFWSEEQLRQFFASLRADRLEVINQLLLQACKPILQALRAELLKGGKLECQRPRKSVPMRLGGRNGSDHDRFADAFRLLSSSRLKDQQTALRMFEQNMRENIRQEHAQSAREWVLYARARIQGSTRVAPDWERAFRKDEASWEEIWNLACYHRVTNDLAEAVNVLAPGLNELDAPFAHLRLALICALTLLLEPDQAGAPVLRSARELLIRHLERWPHPLGCLAWLVLNYEIPGTPLRPLDQSRRLSAFQELLEYPVELPDPRTDLTEPQLKALEDALVSKTHCEEAWFFWLNDYAARHPHNFPAWQLLAETSERLDRLARTELALQHIAGIYYDLDYVYAQEGEEEVQAAEELRQHVEKLFDFYRRHEMQRQAWDSFESCYTTLNQLGFWDDQKPANRKLLALVRPFLSELQRQEVQRQVAEHLAASQDAPARSEIRRRDLSNNPTRPLEHFKSGRRVGIFVDYENIASFIPREEEMERVGQMLASYAAQFGDVVCRWASASPRNLSNLTAVRTGLEYAQFKVRYPRRELQFSASQKDLADYALLECINTASLNDHLDVYLVVSGDRDYYERIYSLLESGRIVRILANDCNLSGSYRELEQQRQRKHQAAGHEETDFFIDDLDEVLHSLPPMSH
ncbi:MAG TPA: NYN domain-containing protein [Ktedonobacteraceae bacterium]